MKLQYIDIQQFIYLSQFADHERKKPSLNTK